MPSHSELPQLTHIPEPAGPESELIMNAASSPEVRPQFRAQVLADCRQQLTIARRWRLAKGGSLVAAACLVGMFCFRPAPSAPSPGSEGTRTVVEHDGLSPSTESMSQGTAHAAETVTPESREDLLNETERIDRMIENLRGTNRLTNCDLFAFPSLY